jgi:hypothetical protein
VTGYSYSPVSSGERDQNDLPGRLIEKIAYNALFALVLVVLAIAAFSGFISF